MWQRSQTYLTLLKHGLPLVALSVLGLFIGIPITLPVSNADLVLTTTQTSIMDLYGHVTMHHDQGYDLKTHSVRIDLNTMTATSNSPVSGDSRQGKVSATGFSLLDQGKRIQLHGASHLLFTQKKS